MTLSISEEDLKPFMLAHAMIARETGIDVPVEQLVQIHVASCVGSRLATDVVSALTDSAADDVCEMRLESDGLSSEQANVSRCA